MRDEAFPCSYTRRAEFTNGMWDMRATNAESEEEEEESHGRDAPSY